MAQTFHIEAYEKTQTPETREKSEGHTHETSTSLLPSFLRTHARDAAAELAAIALRDAASWANAMAHIPNADSALEQQRYTDMRATPLRSKEQPST